ncbi:MAG: hypothetical protein ACLQVL_25105 [Terriglobia bacterium]
MGTFKPDPNSQYHRTKTEGRTLRVVFIPWQEASDEAKEWKGKTEQWNATKPNKFKIVYFDPRTHDNAHLLAANGDHKAVIYIRGHGSPGANSLKAVVGDEQRSLAITDVCQRLIDMGLKPAFSGAIKFHSCYSGTIYTAQEFTKSHTAATQTLEKARNQKARALVELPVEIAEVKRNLASARAELAEEQAKYFWSRDSKKVTELTQAVARREGRVEDLEQKSDQRGADAYIRERELRVPTGSSIAAQGAAYLRSQGFNNCSFFGYLGPMESLYSMDESSVDQKEMHKFVSLVGLADPPEQVAELLSGGANAKAVRASVVRVKIV